MRLKKKLICAAAVLGVSGLVLFGWEAHRVFLYAKDIYEKSKFYDEQYEGYMEHLDQKRPVPLTPKNQKEIRHGE